MFSCLVFVAAIPNVWLMWLGPKIEAITAQMTRLLVYNRLSSEAMQETNKHQISYLRFPCEETLIQDAEKRDTESTRKILVLKIDHNQTTEYNRKNCKPRLHF